MRLDLFRIDQRLQTYGQTEQMVRTGARAAVLRGVLIDAGLQPAAGGPPPPPRLDGLSDEGRLSLALLYDELGGIQPMRALRPGAWDLSFTDGLVVELDEELHFNRYRFATLNSAGSTRPPWRDEYLDLCRHYEGECLRAGQWGKRWTNPSAEAMFGRAGDAGALLGLGAPRWKQRALYDAIKDIAVTNSCTLNLARLSVWDTIGGIKLGEALSTGVPVDPELLRDLVAQRTTKTP